MWDIIFQVFTWNIREVVVLVMILLPKVREFAPEYYNTIPYHTSCLKVLYDYITDLAVGPYARIKRKGYLYRIKKNTAAEEMSNGPSNLKKID